ncbi:hypothetical protein QO014_000172 [Kaistia dalseonensis]|uniref:Uncharacterized protein n=1 Tax=Kaistia dalseonensis TaxID=410840 RepID=A0ABU0H0G9_9HYPH|nr:hypothetical protein [Kaistia dalseonensis]
MRATLTGLVIRARPRGPCGRRRGLSRRGPGWPGDGPGEADAREAPLGGISVYGAYRASAAAVSVLRSALAGGRRLDARSAKALGRPCSWPGLIAAEERTDLQPWCAARWMPLTTDHSVRWHDRRPRGDEGPVSPACTRRSLRTHQARTGSRPAPGASRDEGSMPERGGICQGNYSYVEAHALVDANRRTARPAPRTSIPLQCRHPRASGDPFSRSIGKDSGPASRLDGSRVSATLRPG